MQTVSALDVLKATVLAFRDPVRAADAFVRCSVPVFITAMLLQAITLGLVIEFLAVAAASFNAGTGNQMSLVEARHVINGGAAFGPCEAVLLAGTVGGLLFPFVMAAFHLTLVLRSGSAITAIVRAYRAAAAMLVVLTAMVAVFVGGFVAAVHHDEWMQISGNSGGRISLPILVQICLWSAAALFLSLVRKAMCAAGESDAPEIPPRCENCGYDLSHQPASGLCTECNEPVAASLSPGLRRPGVPWESEPWSFSAWIATTFRVLFFPARFYSQLQIRRGQDCAYRFSLFHYRYLAFVAAFWIACMYAVMYLLDTMNVTHAIELTVAVGAVFALLIALGQGTPLGRFSPWSRQHLIYFLLPMLAVFALTGIDGAGSQDSREALLIPLMFGLLAAFGCWFGHRLGAFFVMLVPIRTRMLADFGWAEKIICYEAAYLWVYCITWGVLVTSIMVFRTWMSRLYAFDELRRLTGLPAEPASIIAVTVFLSIVWIYRYRIALRAVRWNNY